jgi:hypothetical protein
VSLQAGGPREGLPRTLPATSSGGMCAGDARSPAVGHGRNGVAALFDVGEAMCHPFVIGELAMDTRQHGCDELSGYGNFYRSVKKSAQLRLGHG